LRDAGVGRDRGDGGECAGCAKHRSRPSRPDGLGHGSNIDQLPRETPLRRRSEMSVPAARNSADGVEAFMDKDCIDAMSCRRPPFQGGDQAIGRIGSR